MFQYSSLLIHLNKLDDQYCSSYSCVTVASLLLSFIVTSSVNIISSYHSSHIKNNWDMLTAMVVGKNPRPGPVEFFSRHMIYINISKGSLSH